MSFALLVLVLVALFGTALWCGRTLARHHADGWEVAAVAALGASMLVALWLTRSVEAGIPTLGLIGAGGGGLFAGYIRSEEAE